MKKKAYMRPAIMAEKFVAETFCAACETITEVKVETMSAGQGYLAIDKDLDGFFDDAEKHPGNIKQINPQGGTLTMTGEEYSEYLEEREQGFYWPGSSDNYVNGVTLVWGWAQTGGSLSGQGAYAIETRKIETIYKNQS